MENGILSQVTFFFREASLGWAAVLTPFMENFLGVLVLLGLTILLLNLVFHSDILGLSHALLNFLLVSGFSLFMVRHGASLVDSWFSGIKILSHNLGSPSLDPSAIASYGPFVADPIMKSLAAQGMLSYMMNPLTYIFGLAGTAISLAFFVLALVLMNLLILSYLLTAACPFFFAFCGISLLRGVTFGYVKLVLGTMSSLFVVMLMVAVVNEIASLVEQELRTRFLTPGISLTWSDYAFPLVLGIVLTGVFIWIPFKVFREVGGIALDWQGGRMLAGMGGAAISGGGRLLSEGAEAIQARRGRQGQIEGGQQGIGNSGGQRQYAERSGSWGKRS